MNSESDERTPSIPRSRPMLKRANSDGIFPLVDSEKKTTPTPEQRRLLLQICHPIPSDFKEKVRLISFHEFRAMESCPRYPQCRDKTILLSELMKRNMSNIFIVFISHCWLRGYAGHSPPPPNIRLNFCFEQKRMDMTVNPILIPPRTKSTVYAVKG